MLPTPGDPSTDCVNAPAPFCSMTNVRKPRYGCTPTTLFVTNIDPDEDPSGSFAVHVEPDASGREPSPLAKVLMYESAWSRLSPSAGRAPTERISPSGASCARHDRLNAIGRPSVMPRYVHVQPASA